jgi:electron transfer flavoprotein beta subunit
VRWLRKKENSSNVVNVGGPETEPTLRKALAIGANALFV